MKPVNDQSDTQTKVEPDLAYVCHGIILGLPAYHENTGIVDITFIVIVVKYEQCFTLGKKVKDTCVVVTVSSSLEV